MSQIPADQVWKFRECFNWFDKDGDAHIKGEDLGIAVRAMGQYWTFSELKELLDEFPPSRAVSFNQFLEICARKFGVTPDPLSVMNAFDVFDRSAKGQVVIDDIKHALTSVGEKMTVDEFMELCKTNGVVYKGGDQTIDKRQFLDLFGVTGAVPIKKK